jgi:hypothetical protein
MRILLAWALDYNRTSSGSAQANEAIPLHKVIKIN